MSKQGKRRVYALLMAFFMLVTAVAGDVTSITTYAAGEANTEESQAAGGGEMRPAYAATLVGSLAGLDEAATAGSKLVLYHPNGDVLLTSTASGSKLAGTAASWAGAAGELITPDNTAQLTLVKADPVAEEVPGEEAPEGEAPAEEAPAEETPAHYYICMNTGDQTLYLTSGATGNSLSFAAKAAEGETDYALWDIVAADTANDNGTYYLKSVNAAYNGTVQSMEYYNGFTTFGHKDTAVYQFQFYTVAETQVEKTACAEVKASVAAGEVAPNTEVALSCGTYGSTIHYKTSEQGEYQDYNGPITLTEAATIYAYATAENYLDSAEATFAYTMKETKTVGTLINSLDELKTVIEAGKKIILYNPTDTVLLTATANGKKLNGTAAAASAGEIIVPGDAVQLNATAEADGNYSFSYTDDTNTYYLTSGATGSSLSFSPKAGAEETDYALWALVPVNAEKDNGTYFFKNVNAKYNTTEQYLEHYSGFTTFGYKEATPAIYSFQLYTLDEKAVEEPVIANGSYVIYNQSGSVAFSSTYKSNYNTGVALTKNAAGSFDKVVDTEVWNIESKTDGSVVISTYKDGSRLSMGTSYASTPLNDVYNTWKLLPNENGTYYIENVGRLTSGKTHKLEWQPEENKKTFSAFHTIDAGKENLFEMELIPVSAEQIEDSVVEPPREQTVANGAYFIYSASATGVMKYDLTGGATGFVAAAPADGKADFGEGDGTGAAVYTLEWQTDTQTYLIKCGDKYLSADTANKAKNLYLADAPQKSGTAGSYWIIKYSEEFKGYTIENYTAKYNTSPVYLEYYSSSGFCLYPCYTMSEIYAFNFLDATGVENDNGYVGTMPEKAELPEAGKSYVIYNASGKSVIGPHIKGLDGGADSMGAVNAVKEEDGSLSVENGGLIFNVTTDQDGYYLFENNGKYLVSNKNEELLLQTTEEIKADENGADARWKLETILGGFLIKNATAAWTSSSGSSYPVYVEYFSGGFAGYSYKAASPEIFTFSFAEYEDTYNVGYVVNPKVIFNTKADANWGVDHTISFTLDDMGTVSKVTATAVFEDKTEKKYTPTVSGYEGTVTIPKEDLAGHTSVEVTIEATSTIKEATAEQTVHEYSYSGTSKMAIKDEPVITSVAPGANVSTGSNKRPTVTINYANIGTGAAATLTLNGKEVTLVQDTKTDSYSYTPAADMADGKYTAVATITRSDKKTVTKTWFFVVGESSVQVKFGQIHSHTSEYSDGSGTLEQAYEYSMEKAADTDYMIVTDHSNYFDTTATATKESIYDDAAKSILPGTGNYPNADASKNLNLWQEAKATAAYYDDLSSDFVAGFGYEMTWSGGPGHINVFNTKGIASRNNTELNNKTNSSGMLAFYDLMVDAQKKNATYNENGNISAQFNHPGTTFGFFDSFTGWTEERDDIMNLIEVGNGDGAIGGTGYFPSYEYYDMCLSTGWHVAPTNGQDNHKGSWGDSNTARTVALTESFTEDGIYEAMHDRRIYSTEDQNLTMMYSLDGTLQGGIIEGYDKDTVTLNVTLSDADKEALGYVYVIGENGKVLYTSDKIVDNAADLEMTLDNTDAYYYIKVVQADGDIAVSAPVWVADVNANKAKVSGVITNASEESGKNPVAGKAEALKAVLTNNEDSAISVVSYSIAVDGKEVASNAAVNATVGAGKTYTASYNWTPKSYGTHKVVVSFVVTVNGETSTVQVTKDIYVAGADYDTVYSISDAKKGAEKQEFTVEGIVTANASGYDKTTAFFDCIYIQDETGGVNVFPVDGNFQVGQKVRVHGAITYYNGEIELNISSEYGGYIKVIDKTIAPVAPKKVTSAEAMSAANIGLLMQVSGTVSRIHKASGIIDRIYVKDAKGDEACVYINGYIYNSKKGNTSFGTAGTTVAVGDTVTAIGIGSVDVDELGEVDYLHRLRVRDRAEINVIKDVAVTSLTLNHKTLTLSTGSTETLTATVKPSNATNKKVTWKSSNKNVVQVNSKGVVKGLRAGKATVTATAANGVKATCTVTVKDATVTLQSKSVTLAKGEKATIKIKSKFPAKDTVKSFKSSNTKVAQVNSKGVVKGLRAGTATITVTMKSGAKATFKVTVKNPTVTLRSKSATLQKGQKVTIKIKSKFPAKDTVKSFKSSNTKVAQVNSKGVVKGLRTGKATITVTMKSGAKATFKVMVKNPTVTLRSKSATVQKGQKVTIKIKSKFPAKDTVKSFKSSNTKVAQVNSKGVVKGLRTGKATITVTMKSGAKATFKVTVKK